MKQQCLDALLHTKHSEDDKRRELWALARNADKFRSNLERFLYEGKAAKLALEKKEKGASLKRVFDGFLNRKKGSQ